MATAGVPSTAPAAPPAASATQQEASAAPRRASAFPPRPPLGVARRATWQATGREASYDTVVSQLAAKGAGAAPARPSPMLSDPEAGEAKALPPRRSAKRMPPAATTVTSPAATSAESGPFGAGASPAPGSPSRGDWPAGEASDSESDLEPPLPPALPPHAWLAGACGGVQARCAARIDPGAAFRARIAAMRAAAGVATDADLAGAFGGTRATSDSLARVHGVSERYTPGRGGSRPSVVRTRGSADASASAAGSARPVAPLPPAVGGTRSDGWGRCEEGAVPVDLPEAVRALADAFLGAPQPASWIAWSGPDGGVEAQSWLGRDPKAQSWLDGSGEAWGRSRGDILAEGLRAAKAASTRRRSPSLPRYALSDAVSIGGATARASAASLQTPLEVASSLRRLRLAAARSRAAAASAREALVAREALEGLGPRGEVVRALAAALVPAAGTLAAWAGALEAAAAAVGEAAARVAARSESPEAVAARLGRARRVAELLERVQRTRGDALVDEVLSAAHGGSEERGGGQGRSLGGEEAEETESSASEGCARPGFRAGSAAGGCPLPGAEMRSPSGLSKLPTLASALLSGLRAAAERLSIRDGCAEGASASETLSKALLATLRPSCKALDAFLDGDGGDEVRGDAPRSEGGSSPNAPFSRVPPILPFAPRVEALHAPVQRTERYWETPRDCGSARFEQRRVGALEAATVRDGPSATAPLSDRPLFSARGGIPGVLSAPGRRWRGEDLELLAAGGEAARADLAAAVRGERRLERRRELGLGGWSGRDATRTQCATAGVSQTPVGPLGNAGWPSGVSSPSPASPEPSVWASLSRPTAPRVPEAASPPPAATPFRATALDDEDDDATATRATSRRRAAALAGASRDREGPTSKAMRWSEVDECGSVPASDRLWRDARDSEDDSGRRGSDRSSRALLGAAQGRAGGASPAEDVEKGLDDLIVATSRDVRFVSLRAPSNGGREAAARSADPVDGPGRVLALAHKAPPSASRRSVIVPPLRLAAAANVSTKDGALAGAPSAEPFASARIPAGRPADDAGEPEGWYSARSARTHAESARCGSFGEFDGSDTAPPFASHRASAGSWLLDEAIGEERAEVLGPHARGALKVSGHLAALASDGELFGERGDASPPLRASLARPAASTTPTPSTPPLDEAEPSAGVPARSRAPLTTSADEEAGVALRLPLRSESRRSELSAQSARDPSGDPACIGRESARCGSWRARSSEMHVSGRALPELPALPCPFNWPFEPLPSAISLLPKPTDAPPLTAGPPLPATFPDVPASSRSGLLEISAASARRAAARGAALSLAASPAPSVAALPPLEAGGEPGARRNVVRVGDRMAACASAWDAEWSACTLGLFLLRPATAAASLSKGSLVPLASPRGELAPASALREWTALAAPTRELVRRDLLGEATYSVLTIEGSVGALSPLDEPSPSASSEASSADMGLPDYSVATAARLDEDLLPIGAPERRRRRDGESRVAARWRDESDGGARPAAAAPPHPGFDVPRDLALPAPPLAVLLESRLARRALSRAAHVERLRMDRLRRSGLAAQATRVLAALLPGAPGREDVDAALRAAAAAGASPDEAAARVQDDAGDGGSWDPVGRYRIRVSVAEEPSAALSADPDAGKLRYGPGAGWLQRLRYAVELDPASPLAELLGPDAPAVLSRLGDAARLAAQLDWALEDADSIGPVRRGSSASRGARTRRDRVAAASDPRVVGLRMELRALAWGARQLALCRACAAAQALSAALLSAPAAEDAREALRRASAEVAPGSRGPGRADPAAGSSPLEVVARGELVGALDAGGAAAAAHRAEVFASAHVRMRTEEIESVRSSAERPAVTKRSAADGSRSESDGEEDQTPAPPAEVDRWWESDEAAEVEAAKAAREAAALAQRHAREAFVQSVAQFRRRRALLFRVLRTLAAEQGEVGARADETLASLDFSRFYQSIDTTTA